MVPLDLQSAYSLPSATNGTGQVVAIVDAFDDPNAEADMATYRSTFGLAGVHDCQRMLHQGQSERRRGELPVALTIGWALEISLDLDMVSAVCPNCDIILVEANDNSG